MKSQDVRQEFLTFFREKAHSIVPSAPIVLKDDPTLMFTNAGMNPFKEYFLGQKKIAHARIADSQKCLRVSGKHNDLEEVGKDTYHHTMFEMLGNWSFGDYFKKEAIAWAWEFLVEVLKIDKDALYVSVFAGSDDSDGLALDREAYDLWKAIVPEEQIVLGNKKDNFWEMGAQGPCGPCSEIHIDLRSKEEKLASPGRDLVNKDHPEVIEIWNLVFMQFNRKADGSLEKLPAQHVDTGMGFERLCMVMQKVRSNYDTDVFRPLISEIEKITKHAYGKEAATDIAIRVIADHIRAVAFSIADGQLPSNNGAGYVIRRILRRAVRYGFTFLNQKKPFIYRLTEVLNAQMGMVYPEIQAQHELISKVIQEEENSFLRTLEQGLNLLDVLIAKNKGTTLSGEKAFELFDTFGFPIDLTSLILNEKGMTLDEKKFNEALEKQKNRSRAAAKMDTDDWTILIDETPEEFVGYDRLKSDVKISRYRKITNQKQGVLYQIVFDKTPFYPQGGGQVGDVGSFGLNSESIEVMDTKKENHLIVHFVQKLPTDLTGTFKAVVNAEKRASINCNHSATHLLHQALRTVLGPHVEQKGSLVNAQYLRFDFSHFSKVTEEELTAVEDFVNEKIAEALPLEEHRNLSLQDALDKGAMALFGEKYGEKVRMIRFGTSAELCGGTHVSNTRELWHFKLVSEGAVAAGIRRIEAITSKVVKTHFHKQEALLKDITTRLKNNPDPLKSIDALQRENADLKKELTLLIQQKAAREKNRLKGEIQSVNGVNFIASQLDLTAANVKDMAHELGNEIPNLFFFAGTETQGKALLTAYVSKTLVAEKGMDASLIVRELGKLIQGGGGGQKHFATAGGKNPKGLPEAIAKALAYIP